MKIESLDRLLSLSGVTAARAVAPGLLVALVVAAAAEFVASAYGGPTMLIALLLGMSLNFLSRSADCAPGIRFTAKTLLRAGVALLGLRIAFDEVVALGLLTVELVVLAVLVTILAGVVLARLAGRGADFGTLVGGATAICGASAALALSSVLPRRPDSERQTVFAVVAVTTLSTVAMVLYPAFFRALGFDDQAIGILVGATIHDVAQVVGAGYAVSETAGDTATIVKLFRVALLFPVVLIVSFVFARASREAAAGARTLPVPLFVLAFVFFVAANSLGLVPAVVSEPAIAAGRWFLVAAVAAIGLSTSFQEIAKLGFAPVFVAVGASLVLLALVTTGLTLIG